MLRLLGEEYTETGSDRVAILVGPNGSGKSNFLRDIAIDIRGYRNLSVVSNTAHDRFARMRGMNRMSSGRSGSSPRSVVKNAVAATIDGRDSRLYEISRILEYCGYEPRLGFRLELPGRKMRWGTKDGVEVEHDDDWEAAIAFLGRHSPDEIIWIDPRESALSFSLSRDFASVLRNEDELRKDGHFRAIQVYLQRRDETVIQLDDASSGELSLISSLVFLITEIRPFPVVLIDEPENSLHPSWQREYVDKVLAATQYREATIVIATHSPLIVIGALSHAPNLVSVFQIDNGQPQPLNLEEARASAGNIEGILWKAFDVITPANHFVSEQVVDAVSQLERGEITPKQVRAMVDDMDGRSFDDRQHAFFGAVRELIDKVEASKLNDGKPDA